MRVRALGGLRTLLDITSLMGIRVDRLSGDGTTADLAARAYAPTE